MTQEIKLPDPDTHCWDDDSSKDVWSYSPELVRQIIEADRAQRGETVAWAMQRKDGLVLDVITPEEHESFAGEYVIPLYTAPQPSQPAHTEAEVQALCDAGQKLATMRYDDAEFEKYVRRILGVPKP